MEDLLFSLFSGKSVTLLGAGVSNLPLARAAAPYCASLTVRDQKSPAELGAVAEELAGLGARLITGPDYLRDIPSGELVFRSPGIRPDLPELTDAVARGAVLTSEMELFLSLKRCPTFAITGSDGKTTTTTLTSLLLSVPGNVFIGGNIGKPLLYRAGEITAGDALAVELSSFQLMTVHAPLAVAAITNLTPNHLNWHTSMDEYIEAKKNILEQCGRAVLNYDNDITRSIAADWQKNTDRPVTYFSLSPLPSGLLRPADSAVWLDGDTVYSFFPEEGTVRLLTRSDIKLPGLHNVANLMTAIAVTHGYTTPEKIRSVASTFGGVEHRLEFVRELDGVTYINGSIDSSPTRTAAALSALSDRPVVLIAGGSDKHISYAPFADAVFSSTVRVVVATGETMPKIRDEILRHPLYPEKSAAGFRLIVDPDFDSAVAAAKASALPGDTVILSPASASFDRFKNFEERGRHFKDLVSRF